LESRTKSSDESFSFKKILFQFSHKDWFNLHQGLETVWFKLRQQQKSLTTWKLQSWRKINWIKFTKQMVSGKPKDRDEK
jgi:hypothetical protein